MTGQLYYGDNLSVLREHVADESVDLVYLDPPFNSNANYNVLFKAPDGSEAQAQASAFKDTWDWTADGAEEAYWQVLKGLVPAAVRMLEAMRAFLGESSMMAYLAMMAVRLIELRRVLKPTGSLYLHCDPTASHYLKMLLDGVFGAKNYRNEISWRRSNPKSHHSVNFANCRDVILRYSKSDICTFNRIHVEHDPAYVARAYKYRDADGRPYRLLPLLNPNDSRPNLTYEFLGVTRVWRWTKERMQEAYENGTVVQLKPGAVPQYKKYLDESEGRTITNDWHGIPPVSGAESLGYPTQKPLALLERIISASSNPGDLVLDPFCGCGTAVHAAEKLGRAWTGIDITHYAVALIERRLRDSFGKELPFTVHGVPKDLASAARLAREKPFEFERWAVTLIPAARPWKSGGGADAGVDGVLYFRLGTGKGAKAVISVKGGKAVRPEMIRELKGTVEREKALMGIFVTLAGPSKAMLAEAAAAGFVEVEVGVGRGRYPKLQILTVEELLAGARPDVPVIDTGAWRRAAPVDRSADGQSALDV